MLSRVGGILMRKRTLAGVCAILAVIVLVALGFAGMAVPLGLYPFAIFLVLGPLLMIPLNLLNQRLLAWHKARGRDIEEEERYEIEEVDMVSLRPRLENTSTSGNQHQHLPILFR